MNRFSNLVDIVVFETIVIFQNLRDQIENYKHMIRNAEHIASLIQRLDLKLKKVKVTFVFLSWKLGKMRKQFGELFEKFV